MLNNDQICKNISFQYKNKYPYVPYNWISLLRKLVNLPSDTSSMAPKIPSISRLHLSKVKSVHGELGFLECYFSICFFKWKFSSYHRDNNFSTWARKYFTELKKNNRQYLHWFAYFNVFQVLDSVVNDVVDQFFIQQGFMYILCSHSYLQTSPKKVRSSFVVKAIWKIN